MADLTNPIFTNEDAARAHFEAIRWPDGRSCFHCGTVGNSVLLQGKSTRPGLYKCRDCRKPFSATMGTVYERSHIPLHKWLLATHLMVASKKGISSHQLYRMLGFGSYRTAWFMAHRIREAMKSNDETLLGGGGGAVEVDETFYRRDPSLPLSRTPIRHMNKILTILDRATGAARSIVVKDLTVQTVAPILYANISVEARLMTDEAHHYLKPGKAFASHDSVNHWGKEYVRYGDPIVTTNTIEGFFGIFKRGMRGIYQHCGSQHLHRYLSEYDFRYTFRQANGFNDADRAALAVKGTVGRRLMYRRPSVQPAA